MGVIIDCIKEPIDASDCGECLDCTSIKLKDINKSLQSLEKKLKSEDYSDRIDALADAIKLLHDEMQYLNEIKQDVLDCGTNIKTVNHECLLGDGDIHIETGESVCPYPVGGIYFSMLENSPSEFWADTTWERIAKGKAIVGVDEDDADFFEAGLELGEKKHLLTLDEIPSHNHGAGDDGLKFVVTKGDPAGMADTRRYTDKGSGIRYVYMATAEHNIGQSSVTANAGGGLAHNNIQPSFTCYIFKRLT